MKHLTSFCREFRTEVLKLTLQDVENIAFTPTKTLSAFENGRSTNINHLITYYLLCNTKEQRSLFIQGFNKSMDLDRQRVQDVKDGKPCTNYGE